MARRFDMEQKHNFYLNFAALEDLRIDLGTGVYDVDCISFYDTLILTYSVMK